jgi:hypothetical protein
MFIAAIIAAVLAVASTTVTVVQAEKAREYNEEAAQNEADAAIARASREADRRRALSRRQQSRIRTSFAASGVQIDSGSAFDVQLDQAIQGELSAQAAVDEGSLISWQRQTEKQRINFSTRHQQTTTLLAGAGQVAGSFSRVPQAAPNTGAGGI